MLWESRQGPWENGQFSGPGSGLFKSTDGGDTWRKIGKGLPTFEQDGLGRIGITVAPSMPQRMFATVGATRNAGLYRSDDAGENFYQATTDNRVSTRESDFAEVKVDPKNPDVVYTASVVTWKSTDGGKTFKALRGAPGGDDYHRIWINPNNPKIILIASDQGAIVTVNGGESWSSWLNQPTAAFYHVAADYDFPYRLCSGQQESGSACVRSRGDDGRILDWDWHPAGIEEYGYAAPDPLDPNIVYGGKVTRYDRRTGEIQQVGPHAGGGRGGGTFRSLRTAPLVFSTVDPHTLLLRRERRVEDDQRRKELDADQSRPHAHRLDRAGERRHLLELRDGARAPRRRGVHRRAVVRRREAHLGRHRRRSDSNDGRRRRALDGRHARPSSKRSPWSKISIMDAGRFDAATAYAAVNTMRIDDFKPHIYRTHDGGKTWTHITTASPTARSSTSCAKIPSDAVCCSPDRRRRCGSRSTTATTGRRSASTCRRRRFAISS